MAAPSSIAKPGSYADLGGKQKALALAGIMLGLLFSSLNQTVVGTAMPRIITDLGGLEHYAWVTTAFMLASTAAVPIFGKLSDIYGRKWFYIAGVILFMIASVLCGLSQSMLQLVLFRALQGVAGGILMANAFAIIGDLFPPAERGKWQGLMSAVFGISSVVGPVLGGWLTDGPGWRWVFYINLPVGVIAIAVLLYGMPHIRPGGSTRIDWMGAGFIILSTVPLLMAFSFGGSQYAWSSPEIIAMLAVSIVGMILLLITEHRSENPIIPLGLFKTRTFSISVLSSAIMGVTMFGAIIYVPLFMQGVVGASATNSGVALTPMMLSMVTTSIIGGQLISRTGRYRWAVLLGLASMQIGIFLMSRMGTDTADSTVIRNMIIMGVGLGFTMPTLTIAVQNAFPSNQLGVVTSSLQFFRQIGGTIGIAIMGTMLNTGLASNLERDLPQETLDGLPDDVVAGLDPQALANPDAQAELQARLADVANGDAIFESLITTMRDSLAAAMQDVFLIAAVVTAAAVIIGLFIPELPLRTHHDDQRTQTPAGPAREGSTPPPVGSPATPSQVAND